MLPSTFRTIRSMMPITMHERMMIRGCTYTVLIWGHGRVVMQRRRSMVVVNGCKATVVGRWSHRTPPSRVVVNGCKATVVGRWSHSTLSFRGGIGSERAI